MLSPRTMRTVEGAAATMHGDRLLQLWEHPRRIVSVGFTLVQYEYRERSMTMPIKGEW
jgi:hypothetical protein